MLTQDWGKKSIYMCVLLKSCVPPAFQTDAHKLANLGTNCSCQWNQSIRACATVEGKGNMLVVTGACAKVAAGEGSQPLVQSLQKQT